MRNGKSTCIPKNSFRGLSRQPIWKHADLAYRKPCGQSLHYINKAHVTHLWSQKREGANKKLITSVQGSRLYREFKASLGYTNLYTKEKEKIAGKWWHTPLMPALPRWRVGSLCGLCSGAIHTRLDWA